MRSTTTSFPQGESRKSQSVESLDFIVESLVNEIVINNEKHETSEGQKPQTKPVEVNSTPPKTYTEQTTSETEQNTTIIFKLSFFQIINELLPIFCA